MESRCYSLLRGGWNELEMQMISYEIMEKLNFAFTGNTLLTLVLRNGVET